VNIYEVGSVDNFHNHFRLVSGKNFTTQYPSWTITISSWKNIDFETLEMSWFFEK
jgi:hypothetical protein